MGTRTVKPWYSPYPAHSTCTAIRRVTQKYTMQCTRARHTARHMTNAFDRRGRARPWQPLTHPNVLPHHTSLAGPSCLPPPALAHPLYSKLNPAPEVPCTFATAAQGAHALSPSPPPSKQAPVRSLKATPSWGCQLSLATTPRFNAASPKHPGVRRTGGRPAPGPMAHHRQLLPSRYIFLRYDGT